MGKAQVQPDYSTTATFEQIWTILQETAKQQKETAKRQEETAKRQEETDRIVKDVALRQKETDRIVKENAKQQKETDRQIGKLGNRFGEWVEYMVLPNLVQKFNELNFVFTKAYPHATIEDEKNNIIAEIDITLENGDKVMIVEVKSKPSTTDAKDHVDRMKKVRHHADLHDDKRKYLGAVAGMVITKDTREFIRKSGFYVIEPSGETFTITPPSGKPKEW